MMIIVRCEKCDNQSFISAGAPSVCKRCEKVEPDSLGGYL